MWISTGVLFDLSVGTMFTSVRCKVSISLSDHAV